MRTAGSRLALAPFTDEIAYLEDGDWAVLSRRAVAFYDEADRRVVRAKQKSLASAHLIDKGNYRHFMAKEIHEQPEVVGRTIAHYTDLVAGTVALPFALPFDPATVDRLTIAACGTAYIAGLTAKYWFERIAGVAVTSTWLPSSATANRR